jgi:excinuclease ABC subunit C
VQVFFFRAGQNYGNRAFFPLHTEESTEAEIISAFIGQFYQTNTPPKQIILSHQLEHEESILEALYQLHNVKVKFLHPKTGEKLKVVNLAIENAKEAVKTKISEQASQDSLMQEVANVFSLPEAPKRIEVYDNSHIMGKHAVGSMIVAGPEGFIKNAYRRYTIDNSSMTRGGDDYEMLRQVLTRRFARLLKSNPEYQANTWPDLVIIDGGKGQLTVAKQVAKEFSLDRIKFVAMSKGPDRNAGNEQFHTFDSKPFTLNKSLGVMKYLQILRDEAHRFAIGSHRITRSRNIIKSSLDAVPGIGPKRKKILLNHFGSVEAISNASIEELSKVETINKSIAEIIWNYFHTKN